MSYFNNKKHAILKEIEQEMSTLNSNLGKLNDLLKDSNDLGVQFENVSRLWNVFYNYNTRTQVAKETDSEHKGDSKGESTAHGKESAQRSEKESGLGSDVDKDTDKGAAPETGADTAKDSESGTDNLEKHVQ